MPLSKDLYIKRALTRAAGVTRQAFTYRFSSPQFWVFREVAARLTTGSGEWLILETTMLWMH